VKLHAEHWLEASTNINLKFTGEVDTLFEEQMHEAYKNASEHISDFKLEELSSGLDYDEMWGTNGTITEFSIWIHY
jgi:hypothetical protein